LFIVYYLLLIIYYLLLIFIIYYLLCLILVDGEAGPPAASMGDLAQACGAAAPASSMLFLALPPGPPHVQMRWGAFEYAVIIGKPTETIMNHYHSRVAYSREGCIFGPV